MLELLSPAKDLICGKEAINHGADAVYIGAPAFGARQAATNSITDIEALVRYAHTYKAKVYATVNTLLHDDELKEAEKMILQLYNIGVDALIIQDMGLLECGLPPIELHASTQCHNASVERIKFLESVGFRRIILARETSIEQMQTIQKATTAELETFIHGALCVSYSGQCYLSQYLCQRSGNRGCCSQPCRSAYDLINQNGEILIKNKHLLSLRDFNASTHLKEIADSGICSLKIEGRLKDITYIKNITAYYRQLIDQMLSGEQPSSGHCTYTFIPDPDRTFNRGYTDYFLAERQPIASFDTQKATGKYVGKLVKKNRNTLTLSDTSGLAAGDGLCFLDRKGILQGILVNTVSGQEVTPNRMPDITPGTKIWRNRDQVFEHKLQQANTASRKIAIKIDFLIEKQRPTITITDEDNIHSETTTDSPLNEARDSDTVGKNIIRQLSKLGDTPFEAVKITDHSNGAFMLPIAKLNQLRRDAIEAHIEKRIEAFRPSDCKTEKSNTQYPQAEIDYRANVINSKAEAFYRRHGVKTIERGLEQTHEYADKALMTTKYCLRYELGCCLRGKENGEARRTTIKPTDSLYLENNGRRFKLNFHCKDCVMTLTPEQPTAMQ